MSRPEERTRTLREFGLVVGVAFAMLGGWWFYRGKLGIAAPLLLALGSALVLLGVVAPRLLRYPYRGWMALAELLGAVMTRLILLLVFALVVTPIGLLRRMTGADPLRRRTPSGSTSWHAYPARHLDPKHYEKSF